MITLCKNRHYSGVFYSYIPGKDYALLLSRPEGDNELDGWRSDVLSLDLSSGQGEHNIMNAITPDTEEQTQKKVIKFISKLLRASGLKKGRIDFIPVHGGHDRLIAAIAQSKKHNIPKWLYQVT